jgi:uncharacterized membrane protein YebE (DUF533 family)
MSFFSRDGSGMVGRLLRGALNRDGEAPALEELAASEAAPPAPDPAAEKKKTRRQQRPAARADKIVREAVAQKLLDAWLRNRQQTLYPLTMNFQNLEAPHVELLIHSMAAAMLADGEADAQEREQVERTLGEVGARDSDRRLLAMALANPRPLNQLFRQLEEARLGAYAYAASLIALNQRNSVNQLYLDYVAARLAVPTEVVASLIRRYRM